METSASPGDTEYPRRSVSSLGQLMALPHEPDWPYRRAVVWTSVAVAAAVVIFAPGFPMPMRIAAPGIVLIELGCGYLAGWLVTKFWGSLLANAFPRGALWLCLAIFYVSPIAVLTELAIYPFAPSDIDPTGLGWPMLFLLVPASIGVSAGTYRVIAEHTSSV